MRPTARGWGAIVTGFVLFAVGVVAGYPTVRGLGLAFLLLLAASLAGLFLRVAVRVERTISPSRVTRHDPCEGRLTLTNGSARFGMTLDATDQVDGVVVPVDVPWLPAGGSSTVAFPLPTQRVGRLTIGPMTVRRLGFAGLWTTAGELGDTRDLLVVPRVHPCSGVPSGITRGHAGADERVERGGADLTGLREYVPGDDLRRLHWATTARTGTLMIREDADPSRAHLTVLVDDTPEALVDDGDLDEVADIAASLLTAAVRGGHPCRLASVRGRADVDVPAGLGEVLNPTTVLEPVLVALCDLASDLVEGTGTPPALHDTDVLVVVGTSHSDVARLSSVAGALRPSLLLVDRHAQQPVSWAAGVPTLTGPRAVDVLAAWDTVRT